MALRVSQTWVSTLFGNTGDLRVSKTWVSVLHANAGNMRVTKTWVSVLTDNTEKGFAASHQLALVSTFDTNLLQENVSSPLSIVQVLGSNLKQENVSSNIAMVQEAISSIKMASASNTLALVQDVHSSIITISASNAISLIQTARSNINNISTEHTLSLVSVADQKILSQSVGSIMSLQQTIFEHFGVANRHIVSHLDFVSEEEPFLQQFANITYSLSVGNVLPLTDKVQRIYSVSNVLAIVQATTVATALSVSNVLDLVDNANPNGTFGRNVASPLDIDHSLAYFIERQAFECQYNPFVGANGDDGATTPPSTTPPVLGNSTLTLTFPFMTPTTTLVLRNPEFGDTHDLAFSRINRTSRGGTLIVFADPEWPKTQTLRVTVEALTDAQTDSFLAFLAQSLGQEIGLLDWHNQQWRGIVTTPEAEVTDGGNCRKNISFEFEGELI